MLKRIYKKKKSKIRENMRYFKYYKDITLKEETFIVFLQMGTVGAIISLIRAILARQGQEAIMANFIIVAICIASALLCRNSTRIKMIERVLLLSLGVIVFPFLYMICGGLHSAMIYWQILIIAISAICLDSLARTVTAICQIAAMLFIINLSEKYPSLVSGIRTYDDKVFTAVVLAFFCVSIIFTHVSNYIFDRIDDLVEELSESKEVAEKANKSKTTFLASMSHEIRTPLNAIIGLNDINLDEDTPIEQIRGNCVDIKHSSEVLLGIINDILDFSKLEEGKFKIIEDSYSPRQLLNEFGTLEHLAKNKGIAFEIVEDPDYPLPTGLRGDVKRLTQIGYNVINNAIKYTDSGTVKVKLAYVKYKQDKQDADGYIEFVVQDTGKGVREEDIPKLFEAFERIDEKINNHVEGTGLGLAIVKNLVELMNGSIEVNSEYGVGTTFVITIPQNEATYVRGMVIDETPDFSHLSVVCIDDTLINLKVFEGLVRTTGCKPSLISNGRECIEYFKEQKADVIFMDIMMPEMSGEECLKKLRQMGITVPCIALTADAVDNAKERYENMGFNGYLCKPIDRYKLWELLSAADMIAKSKK